MGNCSCSGRFMLSDLLTVTQRVPFVRPGYRGGHAVLHYMTDARVTMECIPQAVEMCTEDLYRQLPWLRGVRVPSWVKGGDWAAVWAWVDAQECRHGVHHEIERLTDFGDLPEVEETPVILSVQEVPIDELPPEIRAFLRQMGLIE